MGGLITNDLKNKLDKVQREYSILRKQNQEQKGEKEGDENVPTVQLDAEPIDFSVNNNVEEEQLSSQRGNRAKKKKGKGKKR